MKIAVIILHFGKLATTEHCLKELAKKIENHSVILVNNTSDNLTSLTQIIPGTKIINNQTNFGFARGVNQGIKLALTDPQIDSVLLLNNDLYISSGTLRDLALTFTKYTSSGIVSPILHHSGGYDWGGKYNRWTGTVKHKNWNNKPKTTLSVSHVAGAAMLISRSLIEHIGLFDERFFLYYEDLDYCLRAIKAGYFVHINPAVVAEHVVSAGTSRSRRTLYQWRSHFQFVTKHLLIQTYPTAYFYNLFFYPLIYLKTLILK